MFGCRGHRRHLRFLVLLIACAVLVGPAGAHEMDAFSTPAMRPDAASPRYADVGPLLDNWMYRALETAVERVNAPLRPLVRSGRNPERLAMLQRDDEVIKAVTSALPRSIELIDSVERMVRSRAMRDRFPGEVVAFRAGGPGVYRNVFRWPDLRAISHAFLSSSIYVHGIHIGTDKVGHFTDVGVGYYWTYRKALRAGATEADAVARAVASGVNGLFSESGVLGLGGTGCYGNADLAANFAGLLFYRNLTEPLNVNGTLRPAMIVRDGPYWRLADHVTPTTPLLRPFVTDHWDEALNPNLLDPAMRPAMLRAVRVRAAGLMARYADSTGRPRSLVYFLRRQQELNTYHGIDYGHRGDAAELIGVARAGETFEYPPLAQPLARASRQ